MKIVHITENYIDGWGYQENLLPKYQKCAGHDVVVISDNGHLKYIQNKELAEKIINHGREYEYDGIKIYKVKTLLNTSSTSFLSRGLYRILEREQPDIIFHHNINPSTLPIATRYKRRHPNVKLYADNHADWINESKNKIWHLFYYDFLIPLVVKCIGDNVDYYIGVSPLRCQYLHKVYHVPENIIRFLPIGCDTEQVAQITENRDALRRKLGVYNLDSFVVVSGGKIDRSKGTLELIAACDDLRKLGEPIILVLFGKIDEEVLNVANQYDWIVLKGWCDRKTTLSILKMADVACWPWLHTTLIEDSVAAGTPLVVKMSDNVSHFAKEGAGVFLETGNKDELMDSLKKAKQNASFYRSNVIKAREKYSYATLIKKLENETFCEI